jgi:hypothetical protein
LSGDGSGITNLNPLAFSGNIDNLQLPADISVTSFSGNGSGITNLNASNITSGKLNNSQLPDIISGKIFSGNGANITNLNASNFSFGKISNSIIPNNLAISGTFTSESLQVNGTTTTINTDIYQTSKLDITNTYNTESSLYINHSSPTTNVLNINHNNVRRFTITNAGNVGIGGIGFPNSSYKLDVEGNINSLGTISSQIVLIRDSINFYKSSTQNILIKIPQTLLSSYTITLPNAGPSVNNILKSDSSGNLSWVNNNESPTLENIYSFFDNAEFEKISNITLKNINSSKILSAFNSAQFELPPIGEPQIIRIKEGLFTSGGNAGGNVSITSINDPPSVSVNTLNIYNRTLGNEPEATLTDSYNIPFTPVSKIPTDKYQYITLTYESSHPNYSSYVSNNQRIHTINFPENVVADILVVGGGGAGGHNSGSGGGAGGLVYGTGIILNGTYTIIVGNGGVYNANNNNIDNGKDSQIIKGAQTITAKGGGSGSDSGSNGQSGGSGGGSASDFWDNGDRQGGSSTQQTSFTFEGKTLIGYGNSGGLGRVEEKGGAERAGGGGGGAGAPGNTSGNYTSDTGQAIRIEYGGDGGIGRQYDISGVNTYYAGGGGGGIHNYYNTGYPGKGGYGGGGNAGQPYNNGTNGVNGTGGGGGAGGGGGGSHNITFGGNGGSGIVIIRYYVVSSITHKYLEFTTHPKLVYDFTPYNSFTSWTNYATQIGATYSLNYFDFSGVYLYPGDAYFQLQLPSDYDTIEVIFKNPYSGGSILLYIDSLSNLPTSSPYPSTYKEIAPAGGQIKTYKGIYTPGQYLKIIEADGVLGEDLIISFSKSSTITYQVNFPSNAICDILVINNTQYIKTSGVILNGSYNVVVGSASKIQQNSTDLYIPNTNLSLTDSITGSSITYTANNPVVIIRYSMGEILSSVEIKENVLPNGYLKYDNNNWFIDEIISNDYLNINSLYKELSLSRYLSNNNYSFINTYQYSTNNIDWFDIDKGEYIYIAKSGYTGIYPEYKNNFIGNILYIKVKSCSLDIIYNSFLIMSSIQPYNTFAHTFSYSIPSISNIPIQSINYTGGELILFAIDLNSINLSVNTREILTINLKVNYDVISNNVNTLKQQTDKFYLFYEQF